MVAKARDVRTPLTASDTFIEELHGGHDYALPFKEPRQVYKLDELIQEAAESWDTLELERLDRLQPDLWRDLVAAYWNENPYDMAECMVDIERVVAQAYADQDAAEAGRFLFGRMGELCRKGLINSLKCARDNYEVGLAEDAESFRWEGYAEE